MWGCHPGRSQHWSEVDLLLIEVLRVYEDALCGGCGQSAFHSHEVSNTRRFAVDDITCMSCASLELARESDGKPAAGMKLFIRNTMSE